MLFCQIFGYFCWGGYSGELSTINGELFVCFYYLFSCNLGLMSYKVDDVLLYCLYAMSQNYRFKPKSYGRWFVHITWQGWLFMLFLVWLVVVAMVRNGLRLPGFPLEYDVNALQVVSFVFDVTIIVFALSWFMEKKCDGELTWRWGKTLRDLKSSDSKIAALRSQWRKTIRKS